MEYLPRMGSPTRHDDRMGNSSLAALYRTYRNWIHVRHRRDW